MTADITIPTGGASYDDVLDAVRAVVAGEHDPIANAANIAAVLFGWVDRLNWAGFYFMKDGELVLGPFQGRVACTRIAVGAGVCGTAVAQARTQLVADVHEFPGHIACDAASESEIVVPLVRDGVVIGVLDIDSPEKGRFGEAERALMEAVVEVYLASIVDAGGWVFVRTGH